MSASNADSNGGEAESITLRELDGATLVMGKFSDDPRELTLESDS